MPHLESLVDDLNDDGYAYSREHVAEAIWDKADLKIRRLMRKGPYTSKLPAIKNKKMPRDIKDEAADVLRPIFPDDEAFGFPNVDWVKDCGQQAFSKYRTLCTRLLSVDIMDIIWNAEPRIMHTLITQPFPPHKSGATVPTILTDPIATMALERGEQEARRRGLEWPATKSRPRSQSKEAPPNSWDEVDDSTTDRGPLEDHQSDHPRARSPLSSILCALDDTSSTLGVWPAKAGVKRERDCEIPPDSNVEDLVSSPVAKKAKHANGDCTIERAAGTLDNGQFLNDRVVTQVLWAASDVHRTKLIYVLDPSYANRDFRSDDRLSICKSTTHAILPICEQRHWMAAYISFEDKVVELFDSLPHPRRSIEWLKQQTSRAVDFLQLQLQRSGEDDDSVTHEAADVGAPTEMEWTYSRDSGQQLQTNGFDCGVCVLVNCIRRIYGKPLTAPIHGEMWRAALQSWLQGHVSQSWTGHEVLSGYLQDLECLDPSTDDSFLTMFRELSRKCNNAEDMYRSAEELAEVLQSMTNAQESGVLLKSLEAKTRDVTALDNAIKHFEVCDSSTRSKFIPGLQGQLRSLKMEHTNIAQLERRCREARSNVGFAMSFMQQRTKSIEEQLDLLKEARQKMGNKGIDWFQGHMRD